MIDSDKVNFAEMIRQTMLAYGKSVPDKAVLRAWWDELKSFPIEYVASAIVDYRAEQGEFAPVPVGIALRCRKMDGRPGDEEAWAMIPHDEESSVVWTQEMASAYGVAAPLIQSGDKISARMAFKEAYAKLVTEARKRSEPAKWSPSLGCDVSGRQQALIEAVRHKRLELKHALSLLDSYPDLQEGLLLSVGVTEHPLLAAPNKENQDKVRAMIDGMKEQLRLK